MIIEGMLLLHGDNDVVVPISQCALFALRTDSRYDNVNRKAKEKNLILYIKSQPGGISTGWQCDQPGNKLLFCPTLGFSLNGAVLSVNSVNSANSANSENLRNHWSMNWVQYKDMLCYLCLRGLVVSSLSLTQEIVGSDPTILIFWFLSFFVTEFSENI